MLAETIHGLWLRIKGLFRRRQLERDLDDEIQFHLAMREEKLTESGVAGEEARHAARRRFGNATRAKETSRELWTFPFVETFWQDVRYGLRQLRRNPGFAVLAIFTLAVGIGASTAIFSVIDAVLLRPLPVKNSAQLVDVYNVLRQEVAFIRDLPLSYPEYQDLVRQSSSFSGLLAWETDMFALEGESGSQLVPASLVTGNYFDTLGVPAVLGRTFDAAEVARAGGSRVAVISYAFWQRRFGGKRNVLGKAINLSGHLFSVIGVAPPSFKGLMVIPAPQIWVPLTDESARNLGEGSLEERGDSSVWVVGRLKPGVRMTRAQAEMSTIAARLASQHPKSEQGLTITLLPANQVRVFPGLDRTLDDASLVLMAVVCLVLLIACANVAAMSLARAASRRKEITVRMAVGAGRWRLVRQLLTESLLLSLGGGVAAVAMTLAVNLGLARAISTLPLVSELHLALGLRLDFRVLLFTLIVVALATVLFGLAPALEASRTNPAEVLKEEGPGGRKHRLLSALVVVQVAFSLVLLICAGLCLRSVSNAYRVWPGFDPQGVVTATFLPDMVGDKPAESAAFFDILLRRVRALPSVTDAGFAGSLPLTFGTSSASVMIPADKAATTPKALWPPIAYTEVGPGYFRTLRIPILRGRPFTDEDTPAAPRVAIVNQALAARFWPREDPIGKLILFGGEKRDSEVIGVAATGKYSTLGESPRPFVYRSIQQLGASSGALVARTSGSAAALMASIRDIARKIDPKVPMLGLETMRQATAPALILPNLAVGFFGLAGLLGLVLACAGLYGVISYSVSQRTHEIGVRVALGAQRGDITGLVLRRSVGLTLLGVGIGLAGAFAVTRVLSAILYGISATDPVTFVGVPVLLILVALGACFVPARRAMRVDPVTALKYE